MHGLDPRDPADRNGDTDGDGYTNLDEYMNSLVPDMIEVMGKHREESTPPPNHPTPRLEGGGLSERHGAVALRIKKVILKEHV